MEIDWQINLTKIKDRNQYILQSEKFADCRFLVGTSSNQTLIPGHRLLLVMASPVFGSMFYGSLPEKDDPIFIPDVHPDAFEAMLKYIYTDEITIFSFDNACDLYYVAKKFMLPHVVEHCTNFLLADLSPRNACRAYEFAKLHEDSHLMECSMEHIVTNTQQVIAEPSFMDIEISTLMAILDQNRLNIDSEVDLFNGLLKLANERGILYDGYEDNETDTGSEYENDFVVVEDIKTELEDSSSAAVSKLAGTCASVPNVADEVVKVERSASLSANASESAANKIKIMDTQHTRIHETKIRQAVKKIRFLSMTPKQFAEGPARSKLLQQNEALAIVIKLLSSTISDCPMPEGFCQSNKRDRVDCNNMQRYSVTASIKSDILYK